MRFPLFSSSFIPGPISRRELLIKTILVESSLACLAFLLGLWPGPEVETQFAWSWSAFLYGSLAALPPLLVLFLIDVFPIGPLRRVKDISEQFLRPILRNTRWPDFFLLSALAGFCEELFFRGWMQPFTSQWLPLWTSNLLVGFLFACCHAITPAYFVIAWLISLYLGGLLICSENLLVPMAAHGVYDLVALFAVMWPSTRTSTADEAERESQPEEFALGSCAAPAHNSGPETEKDGPLGGERPVPFDQGEGRHEEERGEQAEEF
jgi:membrane protease YdiL (CAAX protease family)